MADENADADTASGGPPEPAGDNASGDDVPPGGDATTHEQLEADNEVEEDTVKSLGPEDPP